MKYIYWKLQNVIVKTKVMSQLFDTIPDSWPHIMNKRYFPNVKQLSLLPVEVFSFCTHQMACAAMFSWRLKIVTKKSAGPQFYILIGGSKCHELIFIYRRKWNWPELSAELWHTWLAQCWHTSHPWHWFHTHTTSIWCPKWPQDSAGGSGQLRTIFSELVCACLACNLVIMNIWGVGGSVCLSLYLSSTPVVLFFVCNTFTV